MRRFDTGQQVLSTVLTLPPRVPFPPGGETTSPKGQIFQVEPWYMVDLMTHWRRKVPDMTALNTNDDVIAWFRSHAGEVPAPYPDPPPMLILHTTGRRTGNEHLTPMRCLPGDDSWYVFGSAHGSQHDPDWVKNLRVNPDIEIEVGTTRVPVLATELSGSERETVFARQVARFPYFGELQAKLDRVIPVVHLTPRRS